MNKIQVDENFSKIGNMDVDLFLNNTDDNLFIKLNKTTSSIWIYNNLILILKNKKKLSLFSYIKYYIEYNILLFKFKIIKNFLKIKLKVYGY